MATVIIEFRMRYKEYDAARALTRSSEIDFAGAALLLVTWKKMLCARHRSDSWMSWLHTVFLPNCSGDRREVSLCPLCWHCFLTSPLSHDNDNDWNPSVSLTFHVWNLALLPRQALVKSIFGQTWNCTTNQLPFTCEENRKQVLQAAF